MKKLSLLVAILLLSVALLFGARQMVDGGQGSSQNTLIIYNWGDYIDPALLDKFQDETGYRVVYETFDSNEAMYTKIQQGGTAYDIAIPSDYTIDKMIKEDLLIPLDYSRLEGMEHLHPRFLNHDFDPGNRYSVPYFWGTLGIVYNTKFIEEGQIQSWSDLWKPEFEDSALFIDGAREMIGLTLQSQGHSLNETDETLVREAGRRLKDLMKNAKAIIADELKMYMIQEEAPLGVTFSGEAATMMEENENLAYLVPEEGSNLWFDNIVIPKTAGNLDGAYAFINFINKPENAAQNAEYIGYATPNESARLLLPEEITSDESFYPPEDRLKHLEVYRNLGAKVLQLYNDLFLEAKMFRN